MTMAEPTQSYKNHTRFLPPFHFFVVPVLLVNLINSLRHLYLMPNRSTGFAVIMAVALAMLAFLTRQMVVSVQDRVIRLEMRLRLRHLLPPDMQTQINALSPRQLVALRFASDGELADLVRDVLAGKLTTPKDIKMQVKSWQADWMRA
jgi:Family of unknown function (DUF6526)